jgi:hypothetical protein
LLIIASFAVVAFFFKKKNVQSCLDFILTLACILCIQKHFQSIAMGHSMDNLSLVLHDSCPFGCNLLHAEVIYIKEYQDDKEDHNKHPTA